MAKNKVVFGGNTIIDLTPTTATASDVASGKIFFGKDGVQTTGTATVGAIVISDTTDPNGGTIREIIAADTFTAKTSDDMTVSGPTVTAVPGYYANNASKSVATGTAGTPTASKGSVNNHSITVTPSVTNTTGYIIGGTKTGTGVSVTASELVSGNRSITDNGTNIDVTNYATVSVALDFVTYYTGSSAPSSSLGNNGDIYLQT